MNPSGHTMLFLHNKFKLEMIDTYYALTALFIWFKIFSMDTSYLFFLQFLQSLRNVETLITLFLYLK